MTRAMNYLIIGLTMAEDLMKDLKEILKKDRTDNFGSGIFEKEL